MLRENIKLTKLGKLMIEYFDIFRQSGCKQEVGQPWSASSPQTGSNRHKIETDRGICKKVLSVLRLWESMRIVMINWAAWCSFMSKRLANIYRTSQIFFMPDNTPLAPGSLFNRSYCNLRTILLPTTNNVVTLATAQFLFINHHQSHSSDHIQCNQEVLNMTLPISPIYIYFLLARTFWNIIDILIFVCPFLGWWSIFSSPENALQPLWFRCFRPRIASSETCWPSYAAETSERRCSAPLKIWPSFRSSEAKGPMGRSKGGWINSHQKAHYPLVI